jgi:hypothetical protein
MLSVIYAECHIKAPNAECRYAECRYAVCRGAILDLSKVFPSSYIKSSASPALSF